jgi:PP-loop superfamily ATP-utilizing enzyme
MAAKMAQMLKKAGFTYVALDLEGYRQGSLNESIKKANHSAAKTHLGT